MSHPPCKPALMIQVALQSRHVLVGFAFRLSYPLAQQTLTVEMALSALSLGSVSQTLSTRAKILPDAQMDRHVLPVSVCLPRCQLARATLIAPLIPSSVLLVSAFRPHWILALPTPIVSQSRPALLESAFLLFSPPAQQILTVEIPSSVPHLVSASRKSSIHAPIPPDAELIKPAQPASAFPPPYHYARTLPNAMEQKTASLGSVYHLPLLLVLMAAALMALLAPPESASLPSSLPVLPTRTVTTATHAPLLLVSAFPRSLRLALIVPPTVALGRLVQRASACPHSRPLALATLIVPLIPSNVSPEYVSHPSWILAPPIQTVPQIRPVLPASVSQQFSLPVPQMMNVAPASNAQLH